MKPILKQKSSRLFVVLGAFFVCNALIAEFIGVKIFALEPTLGWNNLNWNLFGQQGSLNFTAGVLLWPIVFVLTDVINEYFGKRGVKFLSWLVVILIIYAFGMVYMAMRLAPADFWLTINADKGVANMQDAYQAVFGQSLWIIGASLIAFLVGQIVDVMIYHNIRKVTGESKVYIRATGSTLISQFIDSFIVLYIAFVIGPQHWEIKLFLAIGTVNYIYKVVLAIALTPAIYMTHAIIDRFLGVKEAEELKHQAAL